MYLNLKPICSLHSSDIFILSSWTWVLFVVSHEAEAAWPTLSLSIMIIYSSWNALWVLLSHPLMWPCYLSDVMTLYFLWWLVVTLTTGRGSTWACFCQALRHWGWCHQGVVLVPVHSWMASKISICIFTPTSPL